MQRLKNQVPAENAVSGPRPVEHFQLVRYFMVTSLVAFSAVAVALYLLERSEGVFFDQVQAEQGAFFAEVQQMLAHHQQDDAREGLLRVHESAHVNLTRVFANVLWSAHVRPLMARAERISVGPCRALAAGIAGNKSGADTCLAQLGQQLRALPEFSSLDARALTMMQQSTVFKIKVFDLRGLTIYSSEHAQVGEDKSGNAGWQSAVAGRPVSELTHRDRFSTFEGVVENRDLISSYIPVRTPGNMKVVGVFEIYSDVTPLLAEMRATASRIEALTTSNQHRVEAVAVVNRRKVHESSARLLLVVGMLLGVLYLALLLLVRRAQRLIDEQAVAQHRAAEREHLWHREKMTALAAMAASVSHEAGNALAIISGHAEEVARAEAAGSSPTWDSRLILAQTQRIASLTRRIGDFASERSDSFQLLDVNEMLGEVCEFLRFDQRFRDTRIDFRPGKLLPAIMVVPDHLHEVLLNLLQNLVSDHRETPTRFECITVETSIVEPWLIIRFAGGLAGIATPDRGPTGDLHQMRCESARRRIAGMGGFLMVDATTTEVRLPLVRGAV